MSQVFLASVNNSESLGHIRYRNILSNSHVKSLEDNSETFDFTTHADKAYSHFIEGNNRVIIPGEDGDFLEFIIYEVQEDRIERQLEVYSYASYIELATAKVIDPHTTDALSAKAHGDIALSGTDWEMGTVEFNGTRTITFDNYTNPFAYLKKIASVFDLELRFRIEHDNGDIVGRYVDLVEKVGQWRGRRVEFGKDLMGLRRIENTENIVTALKVIGPVREDGTRLEVIVEDEEALQRWGRNGQHIITDYEPQFSTEENATRERLIELGEQELAKRVNAIVSYEGTIADLEKVPGLENKKIRFGDTIQIKDTSYEPALYLEARIFFQDRDITDQAQKQVRLGDFIEYTEEEVNAIWKSLQQQIANKIGMSELEEVTYTKGEIDQKDEKGNQAADKIETDVGWATPIESTHGAQDKADQAERGSKDYTDGIKQQIDQELLDKAGLEYVNDQLSYKADSELVNTINNTVGNLQQLVDEHSGDLEDQGGRLITVEQDLDEVEGELSTTISNLSTLGDTVSQQSTQISANTTAIGLKAEQADLETLEGNVTTIGTQVGELQVSYDGISAEVSDLEAVVDGHTVTITDHTSSINVLSNEISSKVSSTYVDNAIADIDIGGRNLFLNSREFVDNRSSYEIIGGQRYGYYGYAWNFTFNVDLVEGETYTVSVPVYNSSETEISRARIIRGHLGNYIETIQPKEIKIITNTFTATETEDNALFRLLTHDSSYPTLAWAYPNLVKGNKATDWTPAPEDVQSNIDSVYTYAEYEITQLAGEIQSKVSSTEFDGLSERVTSAESVITQHSNQIATKVEEDGVISAINQSPETIKIQASNIQLQGAVTVLSDITGNLGTINAGTINGITINGSIINSRIDSNNYTTIKNNNIHSEGVYYSDWANGNQKGVFDVNDGLITMQSGNTSLSTYGQAQISQFGLAIEHYNNNARSGGTYIGPDAIGFGDWYDGPNSKGRIYLSGNDIYLDSNGQVIASAFKLDEIRSIYTNNLILRGYNSGTTELNANGAYLIIGNQNTSYVSIRKDLHLEYGARRIYATSMRTEQDTDTLIQPYGSNGVLVINSSNQYRPVDASAFNNRSLESDKQNIEKWTDSVLQIYRNSDLYKFKLKADVKYGIDHHKYGFVIGDNYNTPDEILNVNKTGVDQYSHSSLNTKAIQELIGVTDDHADEINFLKMEIQYLRGKITQLEGGEV